MKTLWIGMGAIMGVTIGCATAPVSPEKTQRQFREFQARTYETINTKLVMKAMLNVLQDDGYIVKNANVELGLLMAANDPNSAPLG